MVPGLCTRSTCIVYMLLFLVLDVFQVYSFQHSWTPNSIVTLEELVKNEGYQLFEGDREHVDYFKALLNDGDHLLVGGRNNMYNISMLTLKADYNRKIVWKPISGDQTDCKNQVDEAYKSKCQNYIQVLGKMDDGKLFVCGTNALKPTCKTYEYKEENLPMQVGEYDSDREEQGRGKAPFDPEHNSTAVYTGGKLYSATVSDSQARDPLILMSDHEIVGLRTKQHQSNMLSNPHFVSAFDVDDKVYFLFRENAVENINCGKATFSRIARICKNDKGDKFNEGVWTSFFKARLNCSVPGDIPFPFDELQATSDFNSGNFMPTESNENRTKMFYGVFNTPDNSIEGSAVCAFTYDAVKNAFHGKFKGQETATSNWLSIPLDKAVSPHPATTCNSDSQSLPDKNMRFILEHPLMDTAVGAMGGAPVFMQTMAKGRFTAIAVDWQLYAADRGYYDILFVGTSDGRVLKAVNKGFDGPVETVVIEDIQVLRTDEPVKELKIYRQGTIEKLIVISKENIKSIPLHRCSEHKTCSSCVALQDPYCAWINDECNVGARGLIDIRSGDTSKCPFNAEEDETPDIEVVTTMVAPVTTPCPVVTCNCSQYNTDILTNSSDKKINGALQPVPDLEGNANVAQSRAEPCETKYIPIRTDDQVYTASTLAIASVVSIVVAALIGFVIGYRVSMCRNHTRNTEQMISFEQNFGSLRKNPNRHSINEATHNYYSDPASTKPFINKNNLTNNVIVAQNMPQKSPNLPNGSVETKTMSPKQASKTYL